MPKFLFKLKALAGVLLLHPRGLKRFVYQEYGRSKDVLVVSYPKCGRTWLNVMLDKLDVYLKMTHDGSSWKINAVNFKQLSVNKKSFQNNRIILLIRDPRDVIVSYYFHDTKRDLLINESISEYIRNDVYGIRRFLQYYKIWKNNLSVPSDHLVVSYEDLRKDPVEEIKRILAFLGCKKSDARIKEVVDFADFGNMQTLEKEGFFKKVYGVKLIPQNKQDHESYKVRRGKVGGFVDYLKKEDIEYCNRQINEIWGMSYKEFLVGFKN